MCPGESAAAIAALPLANARTHLAASAGDQAMPNLLKGALSKDTFTFPYPSPYPIPSPNARLCPSAVSNATLLQLLGGGIGTVFTLRHAHAMGLNRPR